MHGFLRCVDEAEANRVRAVLDSHIHLTRAEPGCVSFEVTQTDDPLVWEVVEEFADPAVFTAHNTRAGTSDWAIATKGIARDYKITGMP